MVAAACLSACGSAEPPKVAGGDGGRGAPMRALAQLPQDGITLGRLDAPATLTMYATVGERSRAFVEDELPELLERLVRPGLVKVQLRTVVPPSGGRSLAVARLAQGAGLQDRLWPFVAAVGDWGSAQGALRRVPGLRRERAVADARSARVARAIDRAGRFAQADGVTALPAFRLRLGDRPRARPVQWRCRGCLARSVEARLESLGGEALLARVREAGRARAVADARPASGPARRRVRSPVAAAAAAGPDGGRHPGWH